MHTGNIMHTGKPMMLSVVPTRSPKYGASKGSSIIKPLAKHMVVEYSRNNNNNNNKKTVRVRVWVTVRLGVGVG